jgi:pyruvate-formate lyase-activating enzyme
VEVRELLGYLDDDSHQPAWGERLGIYHPIKSEITHFRSTAWTVFDALKQNPLNALKIAEQTNLDEAAVNAIIGELQSRWIVLPAGQEMNIKIQPDFTSEAEVYLETTEACNFGCPGCATGVDRYEAGQAKTMDNDTLGLLLESAAKSVSEKGIKKLSVKWAGGEALMPMSLRLIREGQTIIESLRKQHPNVEISQVIPTNGSHLSEEMVAELKGWNAHVAVSLWGIGEINDKSRGVHREKDKYPNIVKGIERLHNAGIEYNINHVVTPGNAKHFGEFIRAVWDTESDTFIGRDWKWDGEKKLVPVGLAFFRPQTPDQIKMLNEYGYRQMVNGLRGGFEVMRELMARGIAIHSLGKIDYLQLFGVIPTPCGSGFNYLAAGPRGVASCHEALFSMPNNMEEVRDGANMVDLANREYAGLQYQLMGPNIKFEGTNRTMNLVLALHGGSGCPRTTRVEHHGELGHSASTAEALYEPIIEELLSLETMRRLASVEA